MSESNKQLTEKQSTEIGEAVSFESEAGAGFENADSASFAIPFIRITQKMSPVCDPDNGAYIEEAKPGMLIDTVSEELYPGDGTLQIIPCHFKRSFLEWKPNRGGFVAEYNVADGEALLARCTKNDKGKDVTPDGNELADTRTHYVLVVMPDGTTQSAAICMSMTQIKYSKNWMTAMDKLRKHRADGKAYRPAMFASVFNVYTVLETNDQGSWYSWKIKHLSFLDEKEPEHQELFAAGKAFRASVKGGAVTVDHGVDDPDREKVVGDDDVDF